jgi:hypothetical protein
VLSIPRLALRFSADDGRLAGLTERLTNSESESTRSGRSGRSSRSRLSGRRGRSRSRSSSTKERL